MFLHVKLWQLYVQEKQYEKVENIENINNLCKSNFNINLATLQ